MARRKAEDPRVRVGFDAGEVQRALEHFREAMIAGMTQAPPAYAPPPDAWLRSCGPAGLLAALAECDYRAHEIELLRAWMAANLDARLPEPPPLPDVRRGLELGS